MKWEDNCAFCGEVLKWSFESGGYDKYYYCDCPTTKEYERVCREKTRLERIQEEYARHWKLKEEVDRLTIDLDRKKQELVVSLLRMGK